MDLNKSLGENRRVRKRGSIIKTIFRNPHSNPHATPILLFITSFFPQSCPHVLRFSCSNPRSLYLHHFILNGVQHRLRPVRNMELAENIRQMIFYRFLAKKKLLRHFLVAHALANKLQHVQFPVRQPLFLATLVNARRLQQALFLAIDFAQQFARKSRVNKGLAGGNHLQRLNQHGRFHIF